tara:strand:+ start:3789 stop:4598 length:810 start_codon:yes stop_codon:yes gene_type:complete
MIPVVIIVYNIIAILAFTYQIQWKGIKKEEDMNSNILKATLMSLILSATALTNVANAGLITGVTIEDVSSELTANFDRAADMTIDGSGGVLLTSLTGTHGNIPDGTMWLSSGTCCGNVNDPHVTNNDGQLAHIVWDLGAVYDISRFNVWNYNERNGSYTERGVNFVGITTSLTNNLAGLSISDGSLLGNFNFAEATGLNSYTGELLNNAFTGRYVRFDIFTNHGGDNNFAGLSEIRFDGTLATVPEPSTLAIFALGLMGLTARRLKKKS